MWRFHPKKRPSRLVSFHLDICGCLHGEERRTLKARRGSLAFMSFLCLLQHPVGEEGCEGQALACTASFHSSGSGSRKQSGMNHPGGEIQWLTDGATRAPALFTFCRLTCFYRLFLTSAGLWIRTAVRDANPQHDCSLIHFFELKTYRYSTSSSSHR